VPAACEDVECDEQAQRILYMSKTKPKTIEVIQVKFRRVIERF